MISRRYTKKKHNCSKISDWLNIPQALAVGHVLFDDCFTIVHSIKLVTES